MAANNRAHKVLNEVDKQLKEYNALGEKVKGTLESADAARKELKRVGNAMEAAEKALRNSTRKRTSEKAKEQKAEYNHRLAGFMSIRDPSKRYSNAENAAVKDRAGKLAYGASMWNSTKHAPKVGWPAEGGGKRRGRKGTRKSRKSRKSRRGTRHSLRH